MSVRCWGWFSHEWARVQHRIDGPLDGLQNKQIFAKPTGVLCKNALSRWNNPFPPRQLLHSRFSYGFRGRPTSKSLTGHHKSRCEPRREYVLFRTMETWPVLLPRKRNEIWTIVSDTGDYIASSQHYVRSLSPYEERNQWSKPRCSGLLIKEAIF